MWANLDRAGAAFVLAADCAHCPYTRKLKKACALSTAHQHYACSTANVHHSNVSCAAQYRPSTHRPHWLGSLAMTRTIRSGVAKVGSHTQ